MKKITVLMSTYNGAKYINEQLDSILVQKGVEVNLLIRDDGSSDDTMKILRKYERKHSNISIYQGENLKPAKSFLDLIRQAQKYQSEYYALADQDDKWDDDKLYVAVKMLEKKNPELPLMYYSNLRIVDSELNYVRMSHSTPQIQKNKYAALVEYMPTGCTVVFNRKALDLVNHGKPSYIAMHDIWIYLLCKMFGNTVYDFKPHISYRQHGGNVVGAYLKKSPSVYIEHFVRLFDSSVQSKFYTARELYKNYKDIMSNEDKQAVLELITYKKLIFNRLKLLFDRKYKATSFSRDIRNRIMILIGKI